MWEGRTRNQSLVVIGLAVLALVAAVPDLSCGEEPNRAADKATLDEKYEKLKGGLFKSREADVVAVMGPVHSMARPGQQDKFDIELRWQFSTRIVVTYKGGKVSEVWGTFSKHLPVEMVTPENLRRVRLGMTEKEVIDILGNRFASVGMGGIETGQWGASAEFKVAFSKDGRMIHHERTGNSYGPRK